MEVILLGVGKERENTTPMSLIMSCYAERNKKKKGKMEDSLSQNVEI